MKRDQYGIIIQENGVEINGVVYDDGGDSAFSTGNMAFADSLIDLELMPQFITEDLRLVRHPFQSINTGTHPHNDPRATSADQVLAFFSGRSKHPVVKAACLRYAQGWRVNRDILTPAHKVHLYHCAHAWAPLWLYPVAWLNQLITLLWDSIMPRFIKEMEMTRAVHGNYSFGRYWLLFLFYVHPDLLGALDEYFGGWRGRIEIADALENKIMSIVVQK